MEKAIISLRPDSEDSIAHARFLLTDVGDARCIKARTFAVEHGLLPAPPVHPNALSANERVMTAYAGHIKNAQVGLRPRPDSNGCLQEITVWHRFSD